MLSLYKKLQHLFSCIRYTAKHELDIELTNLFLSLIFKKRINIENDEEVIENLKDEWFGDYWDMLCETISSLDKKSAKTFISILERKKREKNTLSKSKVIAPAAMILTTNSMKGLPLSPF